MKKWVGRLGFASAVFIAEVFPIYFAGVYDPPLVPQVEPEFAVTQQRLAASHWCKILPEPRTKLGPSLNFALTLRCK